MCIRDRGGIVAWVLFGQIKKHILVYNEQMDVKLRELRRERAELRTRHKKAFERLDELQKISYTNAMARDASVYQREDLDPEELESEYYRDLHSVETRAREVQAHRALETWVPLLAAFGAVVIGSMMLFKGLKNLNFELLSLIHI